MSDLWRGMVSCKSHVISVSDLWRAMASRKSHVRELKNWMPMHSKNKKKPSVGVELRANGDSLRSEKPGWRVGDMRQWSKQKMHRHLVSPKRVLQFKISRPK